MALRTVWKGFLAVARVRCPVRLHLAVQRAERLGIQTLNRATLHRVQMRPYDPQTGREVTRDALVRGYEHEVGRFVMVEERELAELQIESSRTIALGRFIDRNSIVTAYFETSYFVVPDGRLTQPIFVVLREAMIRTGRVGLGRIVLGNRERAAVVEPRGNGLMLTTLRAAHEVRSDEPYFADIDAEPDEEMVALMLQLIEHRVGTFDPRQDFRDRYQEALFQLVQAKLKGEKPSFPKAPSPSPIIDLRAALEASLAAEDEAKPPAPSRHRTTASGRLQPSGRQDKS